MPAFCPSPIRMSKGGVPSTRRGRVTGRWTGPSASPESSDVRWRSGRSNMHRVFTVPLWVRRKRGGNPPTTSATEPICTGAGRLEHPRPEARRMSTSVESLMATMSKFFLASLSRTVGKKRQGEVLPKFGIRSPHLGEGRFGIFVTYTGFRNRLWRPSSPKAT